MTDLRTAAQQALEYMKSVGEMDMHPEEWAIVGRLETALAEPVQEPDYWREEARRYAGNADFWRKRCEALAEPVQEPRYWEVRCTAHPKWMRVDEQQFDEYVANGWEGQRLYTAPPQRPAEPVQEPYTGDVTRIMREAGMTFHLGLPHKAVVEQMTRVVDLVYAEASIKAAQQFASATPQRPAEPFSPEAISATQAAWKMGYEARKAEEPVQEPAKPLSDADLAKIWDDALDQLDPRDQLRFIARAIERAHKIGGEE